MESRKRQRQQRFKAFLSALPFLLPALLFVIVFLLSPVLQSVWISLQAWHGLSGYQQWAGLLQYKRLVHNLNFNTALLNTLVWVAASAIAPLILGLCFALLAKERWYDRLFKDLLFLPRVLAPAALGALWYYIYAHDGLINRLLSNFSERFVGFGWLYESSTVSFAIIVTYLWQNIGLAMVLILIGLQTLPKDVLEAARLDHARPWAIFAFIKAPLLLPTFLMVMILCVVTGFTVFDQIWVMAKDFPGKRTLSLSVFMYTEAFEKGNWSFAACIAVVLGLAVLSVTCLQVHLQYKTEKLLKS